MAEGIERLGDDHGGVGNREVRELIERRRRSVVVDHDAVEHQKGGPPGAQVLELLVKMLHGTFHFELDLEKQLLHFNSP